MEDIKNLNLEELEGALNSWNMPVFHAKQIFSWIYKRGALHFDEMSDLPKDLRIRLKENFYIYGIKLVKALRSEDGTKKFLLELKDGNFIETVIIPAEKRITGCVSTQVGCKFACRFCASGALGFRRNLSTGEIIEEVMHLKKHDKLTHIVFMGIGEPLDNYDNVIKAIKILNAAYAFNIGARRITISTCGIIPGIKRLANEGMQIELSISLHAATDEIRDKLLPVNKKYPLKELINACKEYIEKTNRQITFEYVLIKDINSDLQNVRNLSKIVRDLRLCKVNLIPSNPIKELNVEPPGRHEILLFKGTLIKSGVNVTLRRPRGQDIEATCGQLRLRHEKK